MISIKRLGVVYDKGLLLFIISNSSLLIRGELSERKGDLMKMKLALMVLITALWASGCMQMQVGASLESVMANNIQATITMEDGGVIVLELYPDVAPQSVYNFVYLARQGYYDGLTFHRIIKGFMIQGGDPSSTGTGGPGYSIKGEFADNGFINDLKHKRGILSMARSQHPDSAGSQFFIIHKKSSHLDGAYAAFGQVVSGMDVMDKIANTANSGPNGEVAEKDMPVMASVTIDDDVELPEPDKL